MSPWTVRPATAADAPTLAAQRGRMFVDMGDLNAAEAEAQHALWADWLRTAMPEGTYAGLLAEIGGEAVGGVGLMFRPKMPSASDPTPTQGYIMNMYVAPAHRQRGVAEALLREAIALARARGVRSLALHAAPLGRGLYRRLGFRESANPELRLTLT